MPKTLRKHDDLTIENIDLHCGDCREVLRDFPDNSFDSVVTDPPYGLSFMGVGWDHGVPGVVFWREILRVMKPGAHLLAFGGTRTYHRLACAIEDAGFEIRDQIQWLYGSGFPKSLDVSKAIDKSVGAKRWNANNTDGDYIYMAPASDAAKQWDGWGTALKPANEPLCLARKFLSEKTVVANVLKWGTGALNIDVCRIAYVSEKDKNGATPQGSCTSKELAAIGAEPDAGRNLNRITFERPEQKGRWPTNVIHDGSNDVVEVFAQEAGALDVENTPSRFFYCAKAPKSERGQANTHPTVKPVALMKYLVSLITPPGGTVLDPFMGSGTTGVACACLGHSFCGMDVEQEFCDIASVRIGALFDE
jgi:site-specific DNA-methyltransferase (adenine-specific)